MLSEQELQNAVLPSIKHIKEKGSNYFELDPVFYNNLLQEVGLTQEIVDKLETVLIRCSVIGTMVMMDKFKDKDCKIELCPAFIVVESVKTIFNEELELAPADPSEYTDENTLQLTSTFKCLDEIYHSIRDLVIIEPIIKNNIKYLKITINDTVFRVLLKQVELEYKYIEYIPKFTGTLSSILAKFLLDKSPIQTLEYGNGRKLICRPVLYGETGVDV